MNTKSIRILVLLVIMICSGLFTMQADAQPDNISFRFFHDQLSPYGQWVDNPEYGNVWIPDAGQDFAPYSSQGYWIMTQYGWTWVSEYDWGWAPFHYGRWDYSNSYGWFWIPDYEWGPAWVNWRVADGYYGWSPMEPGISISVSFGRDYKSHNDHWIFVRDRNFGRSNIDHYYISRRDNDRIIRNSRVIDNTYIDNSRHSTYVTGPNREDVQRTSGRKVSPMAIEESNIPEQKVNNGKLTIFRPQSTGNNEERKNAVAPGTSNMNNSEQSAQKTGPIQKTAPIPANKSRLEIHPDGTSNNVTKENNRDITTPQSVVRKKQPADQASDTPAKKADNNSRNYKDVKKTNNETTGSANTNAKSTTVSKPKSQQNINKSHKAGTDKKVNPPKETTKREKIKKSKLKDDKN